MAWIATAMVGGATLNYMGSKAANARIEATANANMEATQKMNLQSYDVQKTQLLDKATELNNQLGMELTNLVYSSMKATGAATTQQAETNAYGNTAARIQGNVRMKEALTADQITQAAESKLVDIQNELRTAKYNYESGNTQAGINYNNTMLNTKSNFEMITGAASTGLSLGAAAHTLSK